MIITALQNIIDDLREGRVPAMSTEDFPCFGEVATQGNPHVGPQVLDDIAAGLTAADIPTFQAAIDYARAGELAWLGFKVVYDGAVAVTNVDNAVTKAYGEVGSATPANMVFVCTDTKQVTCATPYSPRDLFQMKDVTRGPSMHTEQFEGLTWVSVPLFDQVKVWLLGASDVASEVAALAHHVGFGVEVVDIDPAYLNERRFPEAKRTLIPGFDQLDLLSADPADYVCVLTRGHMADPEGCVWGVRQNAHYVGMMGCKGKNSRVHDLVIASGVSEADWERIKRPIGLKFGAKTPAELAIAIVGELVDVRYQQRYSEEARAKHTADLD